MPAVKKISKVTKVPKVPKAKTTRVTRGTASLSVPVYSLAGQENGVMSLPKEIFGAKVNKKLLAQAVRVYTTNQKNFTGSTKTRGEVEGSTVKIFRQKGTGRARHGAIRAPIFVGGGIVFGPKPRKVRLDLPRKMKKAALISALSDKMVDKQITGLTGLEKTSGKTKEMAKLLAKLRGKGKEERGKSESALIVTGEKMDNVVRAVKNIPKIGALPVNLINAYEILKHEMLLITKEAVEKLTIKKETK